MDAGVAVLDDGLPWRAIAERIGRGEDFALAVVMKSEGSTPRAAGTMALIDERGAITGTIGGGLLEAEAQRRGVEVIGSRIPLVFDFTYHGVSAAERDPICGGWMRVLVFPVERGHHPAFRAAEQARLRRERGTLKFQYECATPPVVNLECASVGDFNKQSDDTPESECLLSPSLSSAPSGGEGARQGGRGSTSNRGSGRIAAHREELVVPLIPPPRLLIFGGGHVGQAVARQASLLDFDITVIDDRPEFAAPSRFPPGVRTTCASLDEEAGRIAMDDETFVAVVTRGHPQDAAVLARCLHRPTAYLGMMGSRRKVALVRREFIESGFATVEEFDRVHAPIGLDLGAETVPEIAASIVAQLVAVRRKKAATRSLGNLES